MKFRWTIKELQTMSDAEVLRGLVAERQHGLNPYTPLAKRLAQLYAKLDKEVSTQGYPCPASSAGYHPNSLSDPRD